MSADSPGSCVFSLGNHFSDPDGDPLFYTHTQSGNTATVTISGMFITITGFSNGETTVTVTAREPSGMSVSDTFSVTGGPTTDCAGNSVMP